MGSAHILRPMGVDRQGRFGVAEAALDALPTGVALVEPGSGRVLYANSAAQQLGGVPDELAQRIAGGEAFAAERLSIETAAGVRELRATGTVSSLGVGVISLEDVTETEAARRRASVLAGVASGLTDSLDLAATLATVGRVTVPEYADWSFVELVNEAGGIDRVLIQHRDPDKQPFVEEYDRRYPLDPAAPIGSDAVLRTGEPPLLAGGAE